MKVREERWRTAKARSKETRTVEIEMMWCGDCAWFSSSVSLIFLFGNHFEFVVAVDTFQHTLIQKGVCSLYSLFMLMLCSVLTKTCWRTCWDLSSATYIFLEFRSFSPHVYSQERVQIVSYVSCQSHPWASVPCGLFFGWWNWLLGGLARAGAKWEAATLARGKNLGHNTSLLWPQVPSNICWFILKHLWDRVNATQYYENLQCNAVFWRVRLALQKKHQYLILVKNKIC